MYEMPTDLQYKDELRKERIRIEDELEMLRNKEYEKLEWKHLNSQSNPINIGNFIFIRKAPFIHTTIFLDDFS